MENPDSESDSSYLSLNGSPLSSSSSTVFYSFGDVHKLDSIKKTKSVTSKSPSWELSRISRTIFESSNHSPLIVVKRKSFSKHNLCQFQLINGGQCSIDMIHTDSNSLVSVVKAENATSCQSRSSIDLKQPLFMFDNNITWKRAANNILCNVNNCGVFLMAFRWKMKDQYRYMDSSALLEKEVNILHCVCKENPIRYQGRIGPISTFVPHRNWNKVVNGIWVSLLSDQIDMTFVDRPMEMDNKSEYYSLIKRSHPNNNQIMFFMSKCGACVGIQVMNTRMEEIEIKRQRKVFHHERPLILEDAFYLIDGIFEAKFLNNNTNAKLKVNAEHFNCSTAPKIVIIAEGVHLIRTTTDTGLPISSSPTIHSRSPVKKLDKIVSNNSTVNKSIENVKTPELAPEVDDGSTITDGGEQSPNKVIECSKIRRIEVCLDCHYQNIIVLDYTQIKIDFQFELNN